MKDPFGGSCFGNGENVCMFKGWEGNLQGSGIQLERMLVKLYCTICPCNSRGQKFQKIIGNPTALYNEDIGGDAKTPPRDAIVTTNILITYYCCLLKKRIPSSSLVFPKNPSNHPFGFAEPKSCSPSPRHR